MITLALTGSIGMGKSTVAAMFADAGIPIFDADAVVRELQGPGGRLVPLIEARFPGTTRDGAVDREALSSAVLADRDELAALEAIVHPAVHHERTRFIVEHGDAPALLFDIPLLFETGGNDAFDKGIVVSACRRVLKETMREIVFDTETTGLSPAGGDRMVEIGCIEMIGRIETGRHFHCYFNPERPMPSEAEAVHGLSDIFLSDKPRFADKADELLDFIGDAPLVAHNASFDFGFLNHELERCGRSLVCMTRMVDTLMLARSRHPGAKHSLDALCTRFGVDRSQRVKHGALLDAQLLSQVYVELTGGRQIGLGLVADTESADVAVGGAPVTVREPRPARPHYAGADELERHRAFIARLVNPLWARFA